MRKLKYAVGICFIGMMIGMTGKADTKAAEIGTYSLSETEVNTKYDITGDGVADAVKFEKILYDDDIYKGFKVLVNDEVVLHKSEEFYYELNPSYIQTKGHGYLFINTCFTDDDGSRVLYEYADGTLKQRMDLSGTIGKVYYHDTVSVSGVKKNQIDFQIRGQAQMLAFTKMKLSIKVKSDGTLAVKDNVVNVSYSNKRTDYTTDDMKTYTSKYLVAVKSIKVYKSATGSKKAFTVKKGTQLKIKKVSLQGKKARFYCVTKSGKKGWMVSKDGLFKDLICAG